MGMALSKENTSGPDTESVIPSSKLHGRQASIRQSTIKPKAKQPMPDPHELERRFTKVLVSLKCAFSNPLINIQFKHVDSKEVVSHILFFLSHY